MESSVRRRVMSVSKPYDYEVQWLESKANENPYINTGISGRNGLRMEIDIYDYRYGLYYAIAGSETKSNNNSLQTQTTNDNKLQARYGTKAIPINLLPYRQYTVNIGEDMCIDGVCWANWSGQTFSSGLNLYLFKINSGVNAVFNLDSPLKLGHVVIHDGNTTLRDFIPVVKGGVGYMYDRIGEILYANVGQGTFGIGPRIASLLPNGYTQIDYIENTSNAYIDTGCTDSGVFMTVTGSGFDGTNNVAFMASKNFNFYVNGNGKVSIKYHASTAIAICDKSVITNKRFYACMKDGDNYNYSLAINKNHYTGTFSTSSGTEGEIYIFANAWGAETYEASKYKVHRAAICKNGVLVRDFYPCINPNNVVGLYDIVNGAFYSSPNGTPFITG